MSENVRRIHRELKYKGKVIEVYQDTMEFEGGRTSKWDYIHHNGAAAVIPVTEEGKILMVSQYRSPLDRMTLEIPAGKLDSPDEKGDACAARELEEETGYKSNHLEKLISLRSTVAFCDEKISIYVAKHLIPCRQNLDEDEFIDVKAYNIEELNRKIYSGEIEDGKTIAGLMAYQVKYLK